jgi:protein O-GlcNAc transferase
MADRMMLPTARALAWGHYRSGRWHEAEQLCRQVIENDPNDADGWRLLGLVLDQQGKPDEAEACYRQAVQIQPDFAEAHFSLGSVLLRQNQPRAAEAELRCALALRPDHAAANFRLAMALQAQGRLEESVAEYQRSIGLRPNLVEAHINLGNVLREQGKTEEAAASYLQALRVQPASALALSNWGLLLLESGRLQEAENTLRQALHYQPRSAHAHYNLGTVLWRQGRPDEAVLSFQRALREQPDYIDAHLDLGNVYKDLGCLDDAVAAYRTGLHLKPDAAHVHSNLVQTLLYHPAYDAGAILQECHRWNDQHAQPLAHLIRDHNNDTQEERRLRVGYVSADFCEHVISFFTVPLLSNHDHQQFKIFCYSGVVHPDQLTRRIRGYADCWRNSVGLGDQEMAELIRADQIDILVDLKLHTNDNRLCVFARKPAPVQVTWLGYPGTTGVEAMDYRLTDPYLDPPGQFDADYSEESIRLPETFWCYHPLSEGPPVSSLPAARNRFITFGCLNNFTKVNDGCLSLWAQVVRAVPGSRLLLRAPLSRVRQHALSRLESEGIAPSRVEFTATRSRLEYLTLYNRIDIGLDPSPYGGHTTGLDAFWMGVPTISLVGKTVVGRAGLSQLRNLGLGELAAETPEQYMTLAAQLANDLPRLTELRSTLRERMRQSPLMNAGRFARNVEQAYREMWRRWCRRRRAEAEG